MTSFIACAFLMFLPLTSHAENHSDPLRGCEKNLSNAAEKFARVYFTVNQEKIFLLAKNDIRYERMDAEYECMANVLIVVTPAHEEERYGIFHIHYTKNGTPIIRYIPEWKAWKGAEPWNAWCDFISLAYPEEMKEQKCE